MKSRTTARFRSAFRALRQARQAYKLFQQNPAHPGLRFKRVHTVKPIFSARVSRDYRVLAVRDDDTLIWFWIGSHSDYDKLISRL
jgi:hypothetical protein